jgi:hypothetical protein
MERSRHRSAHGDRISERSSRSRQNGGLLGAPKGAPDHRECITLRHVCHGHRFGVQRTHRQADVRPMSGHKPWRSLVTALSVILVAGCGGVPSAVHLGASKPSVVQGLPVPAQATLVHTVSHAGYSGAGYVVPVSLADLNKWYERQLPNGQAWRGWDWHSTSGPRCLNLFHGPGVTRQYVLSGKLLMVGTVANAGNSSNEPSFININLVPSSSAFDCQ